MLCFMQIQYGPQNYIKFIIFFKEEVLRVFKEHNNHPHFQVYEMLEKLVGYTSNKLSGLKKEICLN